VRAIEFLRQHIPQSVQRLTRLAAVFALLGLLVFAIGLLYPRPLAVILSMTLGHALGAFAVGLYLIAVILDSIPASPGVVVSDDSGAERATERQAETDAGKKLSSDD